MSQKQQVTQPLPEGDDVPGPVLDVGVEVIVKNRFLGDWIGGFRVAEVLPDGFRIQRFSDGLTFPDIFGFEEVQPERRHGIRGSHLDRRYKPDRWLAVSGPIDLLEQWQLVPRETDDE